MILFTLTDTYDFIDEYIGDGGGNILLKPLTYLGTPYDATGSFYEQFSDGLVHWPDK
jgi:hypothetical protein